MTPADILQIIAMAAVWGCSFLFLRVATPEFGPLPLIAIRVAVTALCLLPVLLGRPAWRAEFRQNLGKLAVLGLINSAIPFPLFAYSTLFVTAGFASIINATAPLFAALVAGVWLRDRITPGGFLGLIVGFGGVVLLVGGLPDVRPGALLAIGGSLFASFLYGVSASYVKKHLTGVNAWVATIGSFGFAALMLAPLAILTWPVVNPSPGSWVAVLLLGVVCTAIPNIYYFRLVLRVGPGKAMSVAFLIPVFGILWGALLLGEHVTPGMLGGGAVILLGTALVVGVIGKRLGATAIAVPVLAVLALGLPGVARAQLVADYCTCVVTKVYRSARDGSLVADALSKEAAADPSFSIDLRSGALTGKMFKASASGGSRVWRSPDRASWLAVWAPLPNSPASALRYLRLEEQGVGAGETPVSFVAATASRLFAGVCLPAPPAAIRPD